MATENGRRCKRGKPTVLKSDTGMMLQRLLKSVDEIDASAVYRFLAQRAVDCCVRARS